MCCTRTQRTSLYNRYMPSYSNICIIQIHLILLKLHVLVQVFEKWGRKFSGWAIYMSFSSNTFMNICDKVTLNWFVSIDISFLHLHIDYFILYLLFRWCRPYKLLHWEERTRKLSQVLCLRFQHGCHHSCWSVLCLEFARLGGLCKGSYIQCGLVQHYAQLFNTTHLDQTKMWKPPTCPHFHYVL